MKTLLRICFVLGFIGTLTIGHSQVNDIVQFKNGTILQGELKKMTTAKLYFDDDILRNVTIDWEDIVRIKATRGLYEVETLFGKYHLGILDSTNMAKQLVVRSVSGEVDTIPFIFVSTIHKLGKSFWQKFSGIISIGASYTKSSDISYLNINNEINYSVAKKVYSYKSNVNLTNRPDAPADLKLNNSLSYLRVLKKRWALTSSLTYEKNKELGLNSRISIAGFIGRNLNKKFYRDITPALGLVFKKEWDLENNTGPVQVEGALDLQLLIQEYNNSGLTLSMYNTFFVGLTQNRIRNNFELNVRYKIIRDFHVSLGGNIQYDSNPTTTNAQTFDYWTDISITFKF